MKIIGKVTPNRISRRFDSTILYQQITTHATEFKYYEKIFPGIYK